MPTKSLFVSAHYMNVGWDVEALWDHNIMYTTMSFDIRGTD
jgi:hypothetical protein